MLCIIYTTSSWFQSTFPRGERQPFQYDPAVAESVSIHVPARGTTCSRYIQKSFTCFNPRSREGNDCNRSPPSQRHTSFQSTFPRGERRSSQQSFVTPVISFNPRSREGNDGYSFNASSTSKRVSIHVPARGTTANSGRTVLNFKFQSTFPRGERRKKGELKMAVVVSIHVPARGTTDRHAG